MSDRPPDSWVADVVAHPATETEDILAREVQELRAEVTQWQAASPYGAETTGRLLDAQRDELIELRAEVERLTAERDAAWNLWQEERGLADQLAEALSQTFSGIWSHHIHEARESSLAAWEAARHE